MRERQLVIFDFDGVIMDTEWAHEEVKREMYRERKIPCPDNLAFAVGHSVRDSWSHILGEKRTDSLVEELARSQFQRTYRKLREKRQQLPGGLKGLLQNLKASGYLLAVCSGSDEDFVRAILKDWKLDLHFDHVQGGDGIPKLKPAPDIYLVLLKQAGIPAKEAVAVEDSLSGSRAARSAGIHCIRYTDGGRNQQPLDEGEMTVDTMEELEKILQNVPI